MASDRLTEVFDRGMRDGIDTLSATDRELFYIQDFILEWENGLLSGYFYNRLPDIDHIRTAVAAMRRHGVVELASVLEEAADLFTSYVEPDPPTTWRQVLRQYDPQGRLRELNDRISDLDNYGLAGSDIA